MDKMTFLMGIAGRRRMTLAVCKQNLIFSCFPKRDPSIWKCQHCSIFMTVINPRAVSSNVETELMKPFSRRNSNNHRQKLFIRMLSPFGNRLSSRGFAIFVLLNRIRRELFVADVDKDVVCCLYFHFRRFSVCLSSTSPDGASLLYCLWFWCRLMCFEYKLTLPASLSSASCFRCSFTALETFLSFLQLRSSLWPSIAFLLLWIPRFHSASEIYFKFDINFPFAQSTRNLFAVIKKFKLGKVQRR